MAEFGIQKPQVSTNYKGRKNNRVSDWEQKDLEILEKVKKAERDQSTYGDVRPIKISVATLGDLTGEKHHLQRNLDRLPKTKAFIQTILDDKTSYDLKCIRWAAHYLISHGHSMTRKDIRSLSKCRDYSEEMKNEINMLINNLGHRPIN